MNIIVIILVIIIILGIIAINYISIYNNLVDYKLKIDKAENIIDEALREKYDAISLININIKKVVKKKDYLKEYIEIKDKKITNYEMDRKLTEAYNIILKLISDYEEINNKEVKKNIKKINELNETLTASKTYYNNNTVKLNRLIKTVPSNIVAKINRYKIKTFFDGKNMNDNIIDDFKL